MLHSTTVETPIRSSFRVQQVAGLFDVPLAERASTTFTVDVPDETEPWQIGLIVGPSGSGKTTIARQAFGDALYAMPPWPSDAALVDGFGDLPIKRITGLLTAVGFSSPPAWVKPYEVLSNGEKFRCDLARALATSDGGLVAFDEFTSVVDRTVARAGSAAIAKAIRSGLAPLRFVAVTCHYDVAEWLEPDWVVDMATQTCQRRRLRRPTIELDLFRCDRAAWRAFARHHYLSGQLSATARCYLATWRGEAVAFCATLPLIGTRGHWRISRIVTLPDYQGLGLGMRVAEAVGDLHLAHGHRFSVTASHPALVAHCQRSSHWRVTRVLKTGSRPSRVRGKPYRSSAGRAVVSFEYLGTTSNEHRVGEGGMNTSHGSPTRERGTGLINTPQ